jgi:glucose/mannose-6-phosphate isomerase
MHKLDDRKAIRALDKNDMYSHVADLPEQYAQAWSESQKLFLPDHYTESHNIVLLGMGGSAIGGSLVKALVQQQENVPTTVIRDYTLPAYVNQDSLVIGVSYSGNTDETAEAFEKAAEKGAKLIAITTGGKIEPIAHRVRAPVFHITYPSQPRAAFGFLFVPLLSIFSKIGLLAFGNQEMADVVNRLNQMRRKINVNVALTKNPAKKLAKKLWGRFVVVMGSGVLAEAARRWKTQINENAKQAAYLEVVPELCHNTIVGLDFPRGQGHKSYALLFPSQYDHPRNMLRMKILPRLLAQKNIPYEIIQAEKPGNPVDELSQIVYLGNFVSYYLAILNEVDPTPVEAIEELKRELARHP